MTEQEHPQVKLAREIATKAHEGQTRWNKKDPYITHPTRIVSALEAEYGQSEYRMLAAAWLHDVLEDTPITYKDLIDSGIEEEIAIIVSWLTKLDSETYFEYITKFDRRSRGVCSIEAVRARIIKIFDIRDNLRGLHSGSMRDKYELALYILTGQ